MKHYHKILDELLDVGYKHHEAEAMAKLAAASEERHEREERMRR